MSPVTTAGHRVPALTVDTVVRQNDTVLLVRRRRDPFANQWALPGGFVEHGETVEDAARRETAEETGIMVDLTGLLGVYSAPGRDPRHHTVTIAFCARPARPDQRPQGGTDASEAQWFRLSSLPPLAFDHDAIVRDAVAATRLWPSR